MINIAYIIVMLFDFLSFYYNNTNILFLLVNMDSLLSCFYYFKNVLNKKISDSQIVSKMSKKIKTPTIDRYIYYTMLYMIYKIITISFWQDDIIYLYFFFLLGVIPTVQNKLKINHFIKQIGTSREKIIKLFFAKKLSILMKMNSENLLGEKIKIKSKDIIPLLNNYKQIIDYFYEIIKNIIICTIFGSMKNYSDGVYWTVKKVYTMKTGDNITSFSTQNDILVHKKKAQQMIINIILKKDWEKLLKPNVYKAVMFLYSTNDNNYDNIVEIIKIINFKIASLTTVWAISSFCGNIILIPFICFMIWIYRKNDYKILNWFNRILIMCIGHVTGTYFNNYLISATICTFMYDLCFNKYVKIFLQIIIKKIKKLKIKLNIGMLKYLLYVLFVLYYNNPICYFLNILYHIIVNFDMNNILIMCYLLGMGWFSNYNMAHNMFNSLVIYCIMNNIEISSLYNFINKLIKKDTVCGAKIIESYSNNSNNNHNNINDNVFDMNFEDFIDEISIKKK